MSTPEGPAGRSAQSSGGPEQGLDRPPEAATDMQVCEHCDWLFLSDPSAEGRSCPHCFHEQLASYDGPLEQLPHSSRPEKYIPFTLSDDALSAAVRGFAQDIPFAPGDLNPTNLRTRLERVFFPMWMVDTHVKAQWEAEGGFDYQVLSHREHYVQRAGGWQEIEQQETRTRWESRLGRLDRAYQDISVPALERHGALLHGLGDFDLSSALPFDTEAVSEAWTRWPDRPAADAWSDAVPLIRARAVEDCRMAAGADHIRAFRWAPVYGEKNWTQLLLPIYTSYYLDDDGEPQPVTIHGQRGGISGQRRSSMRRAGRTTLTLLILAIVLGSFSLLAMALPILNAALFPLALLGLLLAFGLGLSSIIPVASAWRFNRRESGPRT